jgi:hypothetical protein
MVELGIVLARIADRMARAAGSPTMSPSSPKPTRAPPVSRAPPSMPRGRPRTTPTSRSRFKPYQRSSPRPWRCARSATPSGGGSAASPQAAHPTFWLRSKGEPCAGPRQHPPQPAAGACGSSPRGSRRSGSRPRAPCLVTNLSRKSTVDPCHGAHLENPGRGAIGSHATLLAGVLFTATYLLGCLAIRRRHAPA